MTAARHQSTALPDQNRLPCLLLVEFQSSFPTVTHFSVFLRQLLDTAHPSSPLPSQSRRGAPALPGGCCSRLFTSLACCSTALRLQETAGGSHGEPRWGTQEKKDGFLSKIYIKIAINNAPESREKQP